MKKETFPINPHTGKTLGFKASVANPRAAYAAAVYTYAKNGDVVAWFETQEQADNWVNEYSVAPDRDAEDMKTITAIVDMLDGDDVVDNEE